MDREREGRKCCSGSSLIPVMCVGSEGLPGHRERQRLGLHLMLALAGTGVWEVDVEAAPPLTQPCLPSRGNSVETEPPKRQLCCLPA